MAVVAGAGRRLVLPDAECRSCAEGRRRGEPAKRRRAPAGLQGRWVAMALVLSLRRPPLVVEVRRARRRYGEMLGVKELSWLIAGYSAQLDPLWACLPQPCG